MTEFDRNAWIDDARRLLDASAQALDGATLSRLNRSRHAALTAAQRRPARYGWFAMAGVAGSALLLLALTLRPMPGARPAAPSRAVPAAAVAVSAASAESDPAAADDSIEFYQDLDFYAWLDAEDGDGDG